MRLIATDRFPYGRKDLRPGDSFETDNDQDAKFLKGFGKAKDFPQPKPIGMEIKAPIVEEPTEDITELRAEYERIKGTTPDGRWKADRLRAEIHAVSQRQYIRRDLRAED
jgi:hypothetical protein